MPIPRGRRPSTAALTRLGARKASEMVMLTCRTLHFSRTQSSAIVVTRPETTTDDLARLRRPGVPGARTAPDGRRFEMRCAEAGSGGIFWRAASARELRATDHLGDRMLRLCRLT